LSPLGLYISNWLATGPGLIQGDSLDALWDKAHAESGLEHHVDVDGFREALNRAGYVPQTRTLAGTTTYVLVLPDGFRGM
jgi:hypothetical protein